VKTKNTTDQGEEWPKLFMPFSIDAAEDLFCRRVKIAEGTVTREAA
jgi:hypothetical protein